MESKIDEDIKKILLKGAEHFDADLNDKKVEMFFQFMELLKEWNTKMNLTAIEDDKSIIIKHFIDSLSIIPYINKEDAKMIDIGTGAGFPGIPVKIVKEGIILTLFDSLEKRLKFLNEAIKLLELKKTYTVHGRAEEYAIKANYREKFDIAVARAVANLPVLLEYCLPFVTPGGIFIAMKSNCSDEVKASKKALHILGGEIESINEIQLADTDMKRNIIIIRKTRHTPSIYPRKAGKPSKEPLI